MSDISIKPEFLAMLRCPVAVKDGEGDDPGRLEMVNNNWLVCNENGYKYPVVDGIPVMLPEEGERWRDTPVEELPERPTLLSEE